jgi:hypothetical protein
MGIIKQFKLPYLPSKVSIGERNGETINILQTRFEGSHETEYAYNIKGKTADQAGQRPQ